MFSEGRSEMPQVEKQESKDKLRGAFADAVFKWVAALEVRGQKNPESKASKLNLSERLGAAAVPSIFFALLTGCGYKLDPQECQADEQAYIDKTIQWGEDHKPEMQAQMDQLWGDEAKVTAGELMDVLSGAAVTCGAQIEGKKDANGETHIPSNLGDGVIVVNVEADLFTSELELFSRGEYTPDWSLDFLRSIATDSSHSDDRWNAQLYDSAITANLEVIVHEAAHLTLDVGHTDTAQQEEDRVQSNEPLDRNQEAMIDEMYGWGNAAYKAGDTWKEERKRAAHGYAK